MRTQQSPLGTGRLGGRVDLVDIAKGISICLVAFGHSVLPYQMPVLNEALGLFRMPLFFLLAGLFVSTSKTFPVWLAQKSRALLKPYCLATLLMLGVAIVEGYTNHMSSKLFGIAYGNGGTLAWTPLWFLPHLWLLLIAGYLVIRFAHLPEWPLKLRLALPAGLICAGGAILPITQEIALHLGPIDRVVPGLPLSADLLPISLAFLLCGYMLRQHILAFRPSSMGITAALLVLIAINSLTGAKVDLNNRVYEVPVLSGIAAFAGIYLVLALAYGFVHVRSLCRFFKLAGASSLYILIFHFYLGRWVYVALEARTPESWLMFNAVVALVASVLLPLLIRYVLINGRANFARLRTNATATPETAKASVTAPADPAPARADLPRTLES